MGTTNNNKYKYLNKKNYEQLQNFKELRSMLAEKMSIDGAKIKIIDGKKHLWTGRGWEAVEDT